MRPDVPSPEEDAKQVARFSALESVDRELVRSGRHLLSHQSQCGGQRICCLLYRELPLEFIAGQGITYQSLSESWFGAPQESWLTIHSSGRRLAARFNSGF